MKKTLIILLALVLSLSSCTSIKKKIEIKRAEKQAEMTSESSRESLSEETTETSSKSKAEETTTAKETEKTSKKQKKSSKKLETTKKEEPKKIVEAIDMGDEKLFKDVLLPQIDEEVLDMKEVKDFNKQMLELKKNISLFSRMSSIKYPLQADFAYFDTDEILSLRVRYYEEDKANLGSFILKTKTINIDKKANKLLSNDEVLTLAGLDRALFTDEYVDFVSGYLYHNDEIKENYEIVEMLGFKARGYIDENFNEIPLYFDNELIANLAMIDANGIMLPSLNLIMTDNYYDFAKANKLGGFSKFNLEKSDVSDLEVLDIAAGEIKKYIGLSFYESGILEIQKVKRDFSSYDVLVQSVVYEDDVKSGDVLAFALDSLNSNAVNDSNSFYRMVFIVAEDMVYTMNINLADPSYENLNLEYILEASVDYKKKLETSNAKLKNAVNLLGIPLERINQLYGYEYKLQPVEEGYEMKYENETFPVLRFDSNFKSSVVESVFSDYSSYNMIGDIQVGMTALDVEKILGGYKAKVVGGNGLYDSYTVFNIDGYELYVYGKDTDLTSFGMMLKYEVK